MEKIEILDCPNLYNGLDQAVAAMEAKGLGNYALDVPITVILKTTGNINAQGEREVNAIVYIDAYDDDILADLDNN